MMKPSTSDITRFLASQRPPAQRLTPGVLELTHRLRALGKRVYFVSGGFSQLIAPIAEHCDVPLRDVYANTLLFDEHGAFVGHDETQPTSSEGGKAKVMLARSSLLLLPRCFRLGRRGWLPSAPHRSRLRGSTPCLTAQVVADLKAQHGYETVVMIGDGATDMEARDVDGGADAFIGFGGVKVRSVVKQRACWFVYSMEELLLHLDAPAAELQPVARPSGLRAPSSLVSNAHVHVR